MRATLVAAAAAAFHAAAAAAPAGTIVEIEGRGEYREARALDWRPAQVRQPVFVSDLVRTLRLGRVTLLYSDGTQEKLGPNSQLQVREVVVDGKGKTIIDLQQGRSWMRSKTTPNTEMHTPWASASVRGTEWLMEVDAEGRATLTVFAGEIDFFNDLGRVVVRANEQATVERGRAPVKLQLRVSRERMQWVSSATIDPGAYAEFREGRAGDLEAVRALVKEQRLADAQDMLRRDLAAAQPRAVAFLLAADFEVYEGDLPAASRTLLRGAALFPRDGRFDAALARIAFLEDRADETRVRVSSALAKHAESPDALIVLGDLERHEGHAREAIDAYSRATAAAARDARGWRGLGTVESERENVRAARSHLLHAIELEDTAASRAELGTLAGFAWELPLARAQLREALAREPANYVALTGLGVVELKDGNVAASLEALLAASAIEPRYARAHVYLAAAYYQARRDAAAIDSLRRACELDPNDPLPHLLLALIHLDRIEPGEAAAQAREAQRRLPFLKSLNQVADNQKGIASVGAPLALMGLEGWARSAAHDSYLPFLGTSHFFLGDRYPGEFDRRAELMQGLVADPLVLGASNRFQPLVQGPGHYATLTARDGRSDDLELREPVLTLAGLDVSRFPVAYFAEGIDTRIEPRAAPISARGRTFTAAAGAKPVHELGLFIYANHLDVDLDSGTAGLTGAPTSIHSRDDRIDAGARYAPDARTMLMLKGGVGDGRSTLDETDRVVLPGQSVVQRSAFATSPRSADVAVRHIHSADSIELSWGAQAASLRAPIALQRDATAHFEGTPVSQLLLDQHDRDRSYAVHAQGRWERSAFRVEAGLAWHGYRKDRDIDVQSINGIAAVLESYRRDRADPYAGITWKPSDAARVRAACRRWVRPTALDTLEPVAVAGMPLDDQLVLAGGTLAQCRAQAEWSTARVFAAMRVERVEVRNLVSPLDGPLNARLDVTNLDRLRNRTLTPPARPDELEDLAVYGEGVVRRAAATLEGIITNRIGARVEYVYTESANTAPAFAGALIPYLPRHLVVLGATWAPGHRAFVTLAAIHRSRRFADEANAAPLAQGWDAQARIYWETPDKRWSVEAFAGNLFKREASDVFGVAASYRF